MLTVTLTVEQFQALAQAAAHYKRLQGQTPSMKANLPPALDAVLQAIGEKAVSK